MGALSDYAEAKILNRMLNAQTDSNWAAITVVYIALYTAAPSDSGGGTEVSGGSYARKDVTAGFTVSGGSASNTSDITFVTATGNWGTITHVGIFDASSAGNLLFWGALTASRAVNSGGQAKFLAGDLAITLD